MVRLLQKLPFLLELFLNGSFIFVFSLKTAQKVPSSWSFEFLESFLRQGAMIAPFIIAYQAYHYFKRSQGIEDFLRKYIFSIVVLVPLIITWGDLDFAYWLSSAHLLSSILILYDQEGKLNSFEERIYRRKSWVRLIKLSPAQTVLASFSSVIIVGTFFLALPISSATDQPISLIDALFMATSATCVTGLATLSVASELSFFGQLVIMILFQIGGLSIMTLYASMAILLGRSLQMKDRVIMQDLLDVNSLDELFAVILDIVKFSLAIELWGAVVLMAGFTFEGYEFGEALYYGVFHSVAAFCNAGISLFPNSLESFATNPLINGTIWGLSLLGGLGFIVLKELKLIIFGAKGWNQITLHSRVVLWASFALILVGSTIFFYSEFLGVLDEYSFFDKVQIAIFQSSMTRSAGFNTVAVDQLMPYTIYMMTLLMFIGGSPGSTAGGVKTTTLAILVYSIISTLKSAKEVVVYDRVIPSHLVVRATAITFLSILLVSLSILVMLILEPGMSFLALFFEVISAFGTVGLSLGITPELSSTSRILIVLLMLVGRIGPLTLVLAIKQRGPASGKVNYPDGRIMIG